MSTKRKPAKRISVARSTAPSVILDTQPAPPMPGLQQAIGDLADANKRLMLIREKLGLANIRLQGAEPASTTGAGEASNPGHLMAALASEVSMVHQLASQLSGETDRLTQVV